MTAPHPAKYRNFVFTKNNPTQDGERFLQDLQALLPIRYCIFQKEEGEQNGTPHFQGYVELSKQRSHRQLVEALQGAHFEARRGTALQAKMYSSKEETRVEGPWEFGVMTSPGTRTDLAEVIALASTAGLKEAALAHPETYARAARGIERVVNLTAARSIRDVKVTLLYGPSGVGKSHFVWTSHDIDEVSTVDADLKWFDDHHGQPVLFIDEFTGARGGASAAYLNKILDKYPIKLQTKGGHVNASYTQVYIGTNVHPRDWFHLSPVLYQALARRFTEVHEWDMDNRTPRNADKIHVNDEDKNKFFYYIRHQRARLGARALPGA